MRSRRPTNPSRHGKVSLRCAVQCAMCVPQRRAGLQAHTPGRGALHLRGVGLPHREPHGESHNWKCIQLAFVHNAQLQNISAAVHRVLLFLSKLLFSAMKSVCKWYYFDSSGNHLGAKKEVSFEGVERALIPHPAWPAHVAWDLKEPLCQSCLLRVTLIRIAREHGGHLSPSLQLSHAKPVPSVLSITQNLGPNLQAAFF